MALERSMNIIVPKASGDSKHYITMIEVHGFMNAISVTELAILHHLCLQPPPPLPALQYRWI